MLPAMPHAYDALNLAELRERPMNKWRYYDADVLPLWVADMDFPVAEAIRRAIREFADSGLFGYPEWTGLPGVREAVVSRLERRYGWSVPLEAVAILPGIVAGLYDAVTAFTSGGDGVLATTPVYPPFRTAAEAQGRILQAADLAEGPNGYRLDPEALDRAITPSTRLLMLCHPHNPTGRVFDGEELAALAERVLQHRLFVVSDELHADLNYHTRHVPFASLSPEVSRRTVTLLGPSKAFNIAGLKIGFAVAEDPEVLRRFLAATPKQTAPTLSQVAARAALTEADDWLHDTMCYLRTNRDFVAGFVRDRLPDVRFHAPQATYLAWLDFRGTPLAADPAGELLARARLGLNDGATFGEAGRGFVRLNFATSRSIVAEALNRIERVLAET